MALIAAQLYTVRDYCKNSAEIAESCAKVKKMGYDGVQVSGIADVDPRELRKILDGEGLVCAATHKTLQQMTDDTEAVIEANQILGSKYTAIGGFFEDADYTRELWNGFISRFNALALKFANSGVRLGYHNHSHEFSRAEGAKPMDMLINNLEDDVWFEIDTYWVAHGGSNPADYLKRVAGRIPCVHFKDMSITRQREQKMCEVGDGNLNWPEIVEACRYSGVKWYIVERDTGDVEPFESLRRSICNMREKMGL